MVACMLQSEPEYGGNTAAFVLSLTYEHPTEMLAWTYVLVGACAKRGFDTGITLCAPIAHATGKRQ